MIQKLIPIKFIEKRGKIPYWLFKCECGNTTIKSYWRFKCNQVRSCGCLRKERKCQIKHGLSRTRFGNIFKGMKQRCEDKNIPAYKWYGARGIKLDWKDLEEFKKDMYESYLKHVEEFGEKQTTIDRIDNDGDYCKENCKWSTYKEQLNNTRFNIPEERRKLLKKANINNTTFNSREKLGWSENEIISGIRVIKTGSLRLAEKNFRDFKKYIMDRFKRSPKVIKECLEVLNDREQFVIENRLGLNDAERKTLEDVGKELGFSREYIRQIEAKAINKLIELDI